MLATRRLVLAKTVPISPSAAQPLGLFTSAGAATSPNGLLTLTGGAAAPAGPLDAATPYLKLGGSLPAQVSQNPGVRLILTNRSVATPVQPWLINSNGTLFGAATSTISGTPTFPSASTFTVAAPSGTDFLTGGGLVWIVGVGYVSYGAYNATTHVFSNLDTRYSGSPANGTAVYQVQMPRIEPGNTGTTAGAQTGQPGATSWGTLNVTAAGNATAGLKVAVQSLTAVETGGAVCGLSAWMV